MAKYLCTIGYLWEAVYNVSRLFCHVLTFCVRSCHPISFNVSAAIINKSRFVVHTSIENQGKNENPARPVPREKCDAAVDRVA